MTACAVVLAGAALLGVAIALPITQAMTEDAVGAIAARAAELARSAELRRLVDERLDMRTIDRLGHAVTTQAVRTPDIVRVKVWTPEALVRWSDQSELIGLQFPANRSVRRALNGEVVASVTNLTGLEHLYEARYRQLIEVYVPVWSADGRRVIGVFEVYAKSASLADRARWVWIRAVGGSLLAGVVVAILVWRRKSR